MQLDMIIYGTLIIDLYTQIKTFKTRRDNRKTYRFAVSSSSDSA